MAYRRFKLPETGPTVATVATPATISDETGPSVANVATVASPNSIFGPERLGSVATVASVASVASVARAKPKSELQSHPQSSLNGQALDCAIFSRGSATVATPATVSD